LFQGAEMPLFDLAERCQKWQEAKWWSVFVATT
jgi:hypothetical protein